jgi:serine/threonine protein kinase
MSERTIADRYILESKVGSGGMGTVWKATDRSLDRTVAVKILHEGLASDTSFVERFKREARTSAGLSHPNIAAVHDTGEIDDGVPFIVMEYIEGDSLHDMLWNEGPLETEEVVRIARAILAALAHAHDHGLVHRDIKPANVLFETKTRTPKVVDFGIAKSTDDTSMVTGTSTTIGTASYMSPEQLRGERATPASDLYAVGCLLYCCLAGEPPFGGGPAIAVAMHHLNDSVPPLEMHRPDVPAALERVVMRALEKDPAQRFASAQEMDRALATLDIDTGDSTAAWIPQVDTERIRVLLVDDHVVVTQALAAMIDSEHDLEVVGRAPTATEGRALALSEGPDVILLDYDLPDGDGVSVARDVLAERPDTKIVMLTGSASDEVLAEAIEAGCAGFVPKDHAVEEVVDAIRLAYAGEAPIAPDVLARLLPMLRRESPPSGKKSRRS